MAREHVRDAPTLITSQLIHIYITVAAMERHLICGCLHVRVLSALHMLIEIAGFVKF